MNFRKLIKKGGPIFLSVLSCAGVIGTGVASAKATEKAVRKCDSVREANPDAQNRDLICAAWKYYIPTAGIAILSIGCIAGAHILNKKQQAALLAGQIAIAQSYGEYKRKIADIYGEEEAIRVEEQIAVEQCKDVELYAQSITGSATLDIPDPQKPMLFQDEAGGVIFESTLSKVIQAEYHLNRNFVLAGAVSLRDFYDFLGLYSSDEDDDLGWSICDDMYWIDFNHRMGKLENGEIGCIIEYPFAPIKDYQDM